MDIQQLLLIAPAILFALTVHEFSHAYMAYLYGDDTAKSQGRLTLNPLKHLDPLGTIMIFIIHLGWAKPVPVNPAMLRNPKKDMLWISAAGPISNMLLALSSGLIYRLLDAAVGNPMPGSMIQTLMIMVAFSLYINLILAVFNLLPIAPLDGSKILYGLLPAGYHKLIIFLEQYGPFILIGLILLGRVAGIPILGFFIWPFVDFFSSLFGGDVIPPW